MAKQKLRRSQFVLVYGPGSLIETTNGSRLIPSFQGLGENCNNEFFGHYELKDIRMNQLLNKSSTNYECRLVSIPSNTSISEEKPRAIYSTLIFPKWHVCYEREPPILYDASKDKEDECIANSDFKNNDKCVKCKKDTNPNVRFIRACPNGHLDEVYWKMEVHEDQDENCEWDDYYLWRAGGGKLEEITIECPKCHSSTTMRKIYEKHQQNKRKCSGRQPENENFKNENVTFGYDDRPWNCDEHMRVIQKQSTSLRIPITKTLLKIPKADKPILNSLINPELKAFFKYRKPGDLSKKQIMDQIIISGNDNIDELCDYFENHTADDFINDINKIDTTEDYEFENAIEEEFVALKNNEESENFKKGPFVDYSLDVFDKEFPLKVCGVDTLTTVTAQIYYQRKSHKKEKKKNADDEDYELVDIGYVVEDGNRGEKKKKWYPAFLGVGEGIFLFSKKNPLEMFPQIEETINIWRDAHIATDNDRKEIDNPLFVWWHTLSHALIKSLSISCGYSSPSLRERVYINKNGGGGILIYNTSPGDDSGMGGLYDIVYNEEGEEFNRVLENTMDTLLNCSNDPLCSNNKLQGDNVNGSACYNCLLISETSCEHINKCLDRHFFIGD